MLGRSPTASITMNPDIRVVLMCVGVSLCLHISCVLFLCAQRLLVETVCLNLKLTRCLLISPQPNIFHFHHVCRISDTFIHLLFNPYKKPYLTEVESRPWEQSQWGSQGFVWSPSKRGTVQTQVVLPLSLMQFPTQHLIAWFCVGVVVYAVFSFAAV